MSLDDARRVPMDVFAALLDLHRRERSYQEWQGAQLACMTANLHRDVKKRRRPFKVEEFMLFPPIESEEPKPPADPYELIRKLDRAALAMEAQQPKRALGSSRHRAEPTD